MAIRIALIGSEETLQQVQALEDNLENIEVSLIMYQTPEEARTLLHEAKQCDVILFSGELPFYYAKKELAKLNKPALYIPDNELSVALTLLYITNHLKIDYNKLSIDLTDRTFLQEVVKQLNIELASSFIQDYPWLKEETDKVFQIEDVINKHIKLWETKQISYVVTSIHAVYDRLVALNIPCLRLMEPKKNIVDSLIEARNLGILNRAKKSQIAVGAFAFHSKNNKENFTTELHNIAKTINCSVKKVSPQLFYIYGTRSGIEYLLENKELLDQYFLSLFTLESTVSIGFGYGMTIVEAEKNANIALSYSEKNPMDNTLHVVTEEQIVTSPFNNQKNSSLLKSENKEFIKISKELGISVTNLNKMFQFYKTRPVNRFTSSDISDYFGIGKRAAERILKKFADGGYLEIIGEEQPHLSGRPRSIYRLKLPKI
ncbi:hypothetical protein [Psychrobacillus vulpis]|uniref:Transcriptional regulator n=1 Tax=Psychrobacillus vulpis TaxID=2325572 RepID=A0A544TV36_9BACI|nr:hypothetical protein [Psychrobacillus vulpis]TQR21307.1 hypothetical protein FG384_03635 [Psychrobacillus vulpis]